MNNLINKFISNFVSFKGDYLREKYDEATQVKLNKRGRLQVKDPRYKVPSASDLVYLDESPDWCRNSRQLQWPGTFRFAIPLFSNNIYYILRTLDWL